MKLPTLRPFGRPLGTEGFSALELLVVVAVLGIVASLLLPLLNRSEATSLRAQCLANKRQISVAGLMFAADHSENLPPGGLAMLSGTWLTDVPTATGDAFRIYGAEPSAFYEPTVSTREQNRLWTSNEDTALTTLGIALSTKSSPRLIAGTEIVKTTTRQFVHDGDGTHEVAPMETFWAADMTISEGDRQSGRAANNYARVMRAGKRHESAHLGVNYLPEGGNVIAVDGHVEWRRFDKMKLRTSNNGPELAAFWW